MGGRSDSTGSLRRALACTLAVITVAGGPASPAAAQTKDGSSEPGPGVFTLRTQSYESTDICEEDTANENGVWEPGETIELSVELGVRLGGGYTGILGLLQSTNPGVILIEDTAAWPPISGGQTAFNMNPFVLQLATDIACFEDAGLTLFLSTDQSSQGSYILPNVVGAGFEVDLPVALPDITFGTEIPMEVTDEVILEDIDVHIVMETTWVGDIGIILRSPAGTEVVLLDRPGVPPIFGCSNDDMDITFDDESGFDPEDHCPGTTPWYVGDANPVGSLSDIDGESSLGTWTLIVSDSAGGDLAEVHNWELLTTPGLEGPCVTCGNGVDVPATDRRGAVILALLLALVGTARLLFRRLKRVSITGRWGRRDNSCAP